MREYTKYRSNLYLKVYDNEDDYTNVLANTNIQTKYGIK